MKTKVNNSSFVNSQENKKVPKLFESKDKCCGCAACYNKCRSITKSISMEQDLDGFFYPVINIKTCIGCLACERVCPFKHNNHE